MSTNAFRPEEIVILSHWDKAKKEHVKTPHPKVGGRLRLAHEENKQVTIKTEIIRFEEGLAVVKAESITGKGAFTGLGSASVERDERLSESLLELAETRAIARSLRFAGYGVEYCSAEEVSHLEGTVEEPPEAAPQTDTADPGKPSKDKGNGQGNGNDKLTNAQLKAIYAIAKRKNMGHKSVNDFTVKMFGVQAEALSKDQASHVISSLQK